MRTWGEGRGNVTGIGQIEARDVAAYLYALR